jgi:glycine hydroxymethyltransferase
MLVDVRPADITGKDAADLLGRIDITVNMNTIPFDPEPPRVCSGIRLGTPAITTRGMGVAEMKVIAGFIKSAFEHRDDEEKLSSLKSDVHEMVKKFPLYRHRL